MLNELKGKKIQLITKRIRLIKKESIFENFFYETHMGFVVDIDDTYITINSGFVRMIPVRDIAEIGIIPTE